MVDFPTIQVNGGAARREPGDDGVVGRAAAREAVREHRRPEQHQLDEHAGQHEHHAAVRPEPQHRRGRAGRAVDDRAHGAPAAAADAGAAVVPEGRTRRTSRSSSSCCARDTLPLSTVDEYAETDDRAAHLDGERRRAGARVRAQQVRRPHRRSTRASSPRTASASTRSPTPSPTRTSTCRPARCTARQDVRRAGQRPAAAGGGVRPDDHRVPQRQPGPARRSGARLRRRRERQVGRLVQRRALRCYLSIRKQPGTNVVEVVDAVKALLPTFREQLPAALTARRPQRSLGSDSRLGARREVHAARSRSASSSS